MSFHNVTHIKKARKEHRCEETRAVIPVGSPYVRIAGIHEGDFYAVVFHPEIYPIYERRNNAAWKARDEGIGLGDLGYEIAECVEGKSPQDLADAEVFCRLWAGPSPHFLIDKLAAINAGGAA